MLPLVLYSNVVHISSVSDFDTGIRFCLNVTIISLVLLMVFIRDAY